MAALLRDKPQLFRPARLVEASQSRVVTHGWSQRLERLPKRHTRLSSGWHFIWQQGVATALRIGQFWSRAQAGSSNEKQLASRPQHRFLLILDIGNVALEIDDFTPLPPLRKHASFSMSILAEMRSSSVVNPKGHFAPASAISTILAMTAMPFRGTLLSIAAGWSAFRSHFSSDSAPDIHQEVEERLGMPANYFQLASRCPAVRPAAQGWRKESSLGCTPAVLLTPGFCLECDSMTKTLYLRLLLFRSCGAGRDCEAVSSIAAAASGSGGALNATLPKRPCTNRGMLLEKVFGLARRI